MKTTNYKQVICAFCVISILWTLLICPAYAAPQEHEYSNVDFSNPLVRVEPNGEGAVFDVYFVLDTGFVGDTSFAALEGHGIGQAQWPPIPFREGYTFAGWYDNAERSGDPYSMDTPIFQNTELYAKWIYSGSGGCWPRPHRGIIHGIVEGDSIGINQTITLNAEGYNMHLTAPKDQRFRWIPTNWRIGDEINGDFSVEAQFTAEFSIHSQGEYILYITYKEEVFDGIIWQETGQVHEVEELSFQVKA